MIIANTNGVRHDVTPVDLTTGVVVVKGNDALYAVIRDDYVHKITWIETTTAYVPLSAEEQELLRSCRIKCKVFTFLHLTTEDKPGSINI